MSFIVSMNEEWYVTLIKSELYFLILWWKTLIMYLKVICMTLDSLYTDFWTTVNKIYWAVISNSSTAACPIFIVLQAVNTMVQYTEFTKV